MDQGQIDIVSTQLLQALFQAWDQLVFTEVLDPDFGGDKQFVTRYTAFFNRLANRSFIFINLRGINCAIAKLKGGFDRCDNNVVFQAESAQA